MARVSTLLGHRMRKYGLEDHNNNIERIVALCSFYCLIDFGPG